MAKKTTTTKKQAKPAVPAAKAAAPIPATKAAPLRKPAAKKPAAKKPASPRKPAAPPKISSDDLALRAYFLGEKRQQLGLAGDSHSDWIEAERQLLAEHGVKRRQA